jgi:hypothetical protein
MFISANQEIMSKIGEELLSLLRKGDVRIIDEVTYFEEHTNPVQVRANSLYTLFLEWAEDQEIEPSDRNFYKVLFQTMSRLNAKKKIEVRVTSESSLCILLSPNTLEV